MLRNSLKLIVAAVAVWAAGAGLGRAQTVSGSCPRSMDALFDGASPSCASGKNSVPVDIPGFPDNFWKPAGKSADEAKTPESSKQKQDNYNNMLWNGIADKLCRDIKIPISAAYAPSLSVGKGAVTPGLSFTGQRFVRINENNRYTMVDELGLSPHILGTRQLARFGPNGSVSASIGAQLSGLSQVIRPLDGGNSCEYALQAAKIWKAKLAIPLTADRFQEMAVDEIWNVPVVFQTTVGLGAGASSAGVPFSVSFGYSRDGGVSVSVRRFQVRIVDAKNAQPKLVDRLRMRIRIDYAQIYGGSLGASYDTLPVTFPGTRDRLMSLNIFGKVMHQIHLDDLLVGQLWGWLDHYLAANASIGMQRGDEDHYLIEFDADPTDATQMETLARLIDTGDLVGIDAFSKLHGIKDLGELVKAAKTAYLHSEDFSGKLLGDKAYNVLLEAVESRPSVEAIVEAGDTVRSFIGTDRVQDIAGFSLPLKIPVIANLLWQTDNRGDHIAVYDNTVPDKVVERFHVYRAQSAHNLGFLDIPFVGAWFGYNDQRVAVAYTREGSEGNTSGAALMYTRLEGFTNQQERTARSLSVTVEDITRLIGAGTKEDPRVRLPAEAVFPPEPRRAVRADDAGRPQPEPGYRRGNGSFMMTLSPQAVSQALSASPADIVRAYARASSQWINGDLLRWAVENGRISDDGSVTYDRDAAVRLFPIAYADRQNSVTYTDPVDTRLEFARDFAGKLKEIAAIAPPTSTDAGAARKQAEALRELFRHGERYWLSQDDLLKILVQFAPTDQVAAEYAVMADPSDKKGQKIDGRYLFQERTLEQDPLIHRLNTLRQQFNRIPYSD